MRKFVGQFFIVTGVCVAVYSIPSNVAEQDSKGAARFTAEDARLQPAARTTATVGVFRPAVNSVPSKLLPPTPGQFSASQPDKDKQLLAVARDLQRELTRVGCFDGEINGVWDDGSKAAMSAFTRRVNATLRVDEPDSILLTLVQGHFKRACSQPCSPNAPLSNDGRCRPRAIQAAVTQSGPADVAGLGRPETATAGSAPAMRDLKAEFVPVASKVQQNSGKIDAIAKSLAPARLAALRSTPEQPAIVTDTRIRTPSISPAENEAARREEAARRRAAARKRGQVRRLAAARRRVVQRLRDRQLAAIAAALAEKRFQERRRIAAAATLAAQRAEEQSLAAEAARAETRNRVADRRRAQDRKKARARRRAEERRLAAKADRAQSRERAAARIKARNRRKARSRRAERRRLAARAARASQRRRAKASRRAQTRPKARRSRRRIARANVGRKSYVGAKKRRRARPRRSNRRRRSGWKKNFWRSQGM